VQVPDEYSSQWQTTEGTGMNKRQIWMFAAPMIAALIVTRPAPAEAAMCSSNGSKCKADNPGQCCSGVCDLAKPGDTEGTCKALE
jgi:hypothetical protein